MNYFGRTPESDNINIKPILMSKGRTKLALFGMSNVRDERLYRTFRDGKVKFFRPRDDQDEFFNLMTVHQNQYVFYLNIMLISSHAHTETSYLPENFLPSFLDFVLWGHEHECLIDPRRNPETDFYVMQPGSSVATSLCPGEAVEKRIAILSITGRDFKTESIRLKTVRPFIMKEIVLLEEKGLAAIAKKRDNRNDVSRYLVKVVEEMIQEALDEWMEGQTPSNEAIKAPLPLVRLRVEYSAPEPGNFEIENPQRFSNRFMGKVANVHDVVQFHRRKTGGASMFN